MVVGLRRNRMYKPFTDPNYPLKDPGPNTLWDWEGDVKEELKGVQAKNLEIKPELLGVYTFQASKIARWKLTDDYWIDIPWPEQDIFTIRGRQYVFTTRLIGNLEDVTVLKPSRLYGSNIKKHLSWLFRSRKKKSLADTFHKIYGRLSQYSLFQLADSTNLTSLESHKRRVYNPAKSIRDILDVFRGRLCPIETPESTKIGLTLHLAKDAKVRKTTGEILAPFLDDENNVIYLSAKEEMSLAAKRGISNLPLAWPDAIFSKAAAQVPFIQLNDPNRVLMGTNHIKQALPLSSKEAPIIRTGYEQEPAGANLLVAYAHFKGITYEDAVVISQSAAERLTASKYYLIESNVTRKETLIPGYYYAPHLGKDGIAKEGYYVGEFDILVAKAKRLDTSEVSQVLNLPGVDGYIPDPTVVPRFTSGVIDRVTVMDRPRRYIKQTILIRLKQTMPVREGDKLSGRYGNKGVVGLVMPDEDMPRLPDGRSVDMIISPSSVISRMNLGQLMETQLSWIVKEYGKDHENIIRQYLGSALQGTYPNLYVEAEHFGSLGVETLLQLQDALGIPDKLPLYDPVQDRSLGQAVVGYQYILRLYHTAIDKLSGRSTGPVDYLDMPVGGRGRRGGQRVGEMEGWALKAHGAAHLYRELRAIRSDSRGGRSKSSFDVEAGKPIHLEEYNGVTGVSFSLLLTVLAASGLKIETTGLEGEIIDTSS